MIGGVAVSSTSDIHLILIVHDATTGTGGNADCVPGVISLG